MTEYSCQVSTSTEQSTRAPQLRSSFLSFQVTICAVRIAEVHEAHHAGSFARCTRAGVCGARNRTWRARCRRLASSHNTRALARSLLGFPRGLTSATSQPAYMCKRNADNAGAIACTTPRRTRKLRRNEYRTATSCTLPFLAL